MRKILGIIIFATLMISGAAAWPTDPLPSTNPDIVKIGIDTGSSLTCFYAWQDPATGLWEVRMGAYDYMGRFIPLPITYLSDKDGVVVVDLRS